MYGPVMNENITLLALKAPITNLVVFANSVDPDQPALKRAV